jgi:hypothetical protein
MTKPLEARSVAPKCGAVEPLAVAGLGQAGTAQAQAQAQTWTVSPAAPQPAELPGQALEPPPGLGPLILPSGGGMLMFVLGSVLSGLPSGGGMT